MDCRLLLHCTSLAGAAQVCGDGVDEHDNAGPPCVVPEQRDGEAFRLRQRGLGPAARHGFGDARAARSAAGFRVLVCANDRDPDKDGPALLESAWGRCMTQHTAWHTKENKTGWASAPRRVWRRPEHRPLRIQQRWARFSLWIFDDLAARLMHGGQSVADPPSYTFSASSFGVCCARGALGPLGRSSSVGSTRSHLA